MTWKVTGTQRVTHGHGDVDAATYTAPPAPPIFIGGFDTSDMVLQEFHDRIVGEFIAPETWQEVLWRNAAMLIFGSLYAYVVGIVIGILWNVI